MKPHPYQKLSKDRLEFLSNGPRDREFLVGHEKQQTANIIEEATMAQEILESRKEVDTLRDDRRRLQIEVCNLREEVAQLRAERADNLAVAVNMQRNGAHLPSLPDPEIIRLRQRVDALEQAMHPKPPPADTRPIGDGRPLAPLTMIFQGAYSDGVLGALMTDKERGA